MPHVRWSLVVALLMSAVLVDAPSVCGQATDTPAATEQPEETAQQPQRARQRRRGPRPGQKPGEIITPPDLSEGRWADKIEVGQPAPEFSLPLLDRDSAPGDVLPPGAVPMVSLEQLRAEQPAVLIFGSITCPPFRGQLEGVDKVHQEFQDRAKFLFVYVREAHPDSVLSVIQADGKESLVKIVQPADDSTRTTTAALCQRTIELTMPIAVDTIENTVGKAYSGWPNRMVVVGTDGNVLFASPGAPRGTDAKKLRTWLSENLPSPKK